MPLNIHLSVGGILIRDIEQFISSMNDDYYNNGYLEYEISKVVNEYNRITNVF